MLHTALWSGNAHPRLAKAIAQHLGFPLWPVPVQTFADGEIAIQMPHTLQTQVLILVQSLCAPVHHHLIELLDAAHQAGCKHLTVVIPYFAYAREANSAQLVADLLAVRPIHKLIVLDLHTPELEHIFSSSLSHLHSTTLFAEHIQEKNPLIVSPDVGGAQRAQRLASALKTDYSVLDKKVLGKNDLSNTLKDRCCILIDDIVDTGKTLCNAAYFLKQQEARHVFCYVTHAVLSDQALQTLLSSDLDTIGISDSIPLSRSHQQFLNQNPYQAKKLEIFSLGSLLAQSIIKAMG